MARTLEVFLPVSRRARIRIYIGKKHAERGDERRFISYGEVFPQCAARRAWIFIRSRFALFRSRATIK